LISHERLESAGRFPDEVVRHIKSGDRVFIHGASATPIPLIDAMCRRTELRDVTLVHLHTAGDCAFGRPEHAGRFRSVSVFAGAPLRGPIAEGRADFVPVFLSDIPSLFTDGFMPLDVAIVQLSPPNAHGQATLGTSVDAALAATLSAKIVLGDVNAQMPRTLGNTVVPMSKVAAFSRTDRPLIEAAHSELSEDAEKIGRIIADLVPDGACLQMGIGAIPTQCCHGWGTRTTWASTPRCSPTDWSRSFRTAT